MFTGLVSLTWSWGKSRYRPGEEGGKLWFTSALPSVPLDPAPTTSFYFSFHSISASFPSLPPPSYLSSPSPWFCPSSPETVGEAAPQPCRTEHTPNPSAGTTVKGFWTPVSRTGPHSQARWQHPTGVGAGLGLGWAWEALSHCAVEPVALP